MKKQLKILCLFDYKAGTGFATVSKNLMQHFKRKFKGQIKWDICAINYFGDAFDEDEDTFVFSAIKSASKRDDFGRYGFLKILKESNEYDGVIIIQDLGVIQPIIAQLKWINDFKKENNQKQFKSIFYFPVDCALIPELLKDIEFFDVLLTYTEFAREEVLKIKPDLKGKLKVIPHGNNSTDFYPLSREESQKFREEYFGKNADKFIITNVNRNQPRKDIPTTIFGFIEAKKNWLYSQKPFLYLHMNPKDPMGWDLRAILMQTDLVEGEDYMLIPKEVENHQASIKVLNSIYNASDVFVTTTLGEGWGLTVTEAFACCCPVIAPYNTSLMEIGGYNSSRMIHLKTQIPCCNTIDNVIREQSDFGELADVLVAIPVLLNTGELTSKRNNAYKYVTDLSWEYVAKRWIEYIEECFF